MKPILFNTDMVRAILDGRKTVTRRVVKPQPVWSSCDMRLVWKNVGWWREGWNPIETITWKHTPYRPGDILYVRETFCRQPSEEYPFVYKASVETPAAWQWCPSIHMPREAARIFLRVTGVRVERLRDITLADALKEDCERPMHFDELWNSTIKKADRALYGWEADPWVWVIEFERISREEVEA